MLPNILGGLCPSEEGLVPTREEQNFLDMGGLMPLSHGPHLRSNSNIPTVLETRAKQVRDFSSAPS